jgi:His/Glu/Gln/Arg/opine family amino acid ABC transporter permease subunit
LFISLDILNLSDNPKCVGSGLGLLINSTNPVVVVLKQIFKIYVSVFRGTPIVVQLLIIYFVIFASFRGDSIYIAIIAFGLNSGAYVSEILRGGILSLPKGQMEAGRSLGLTYPTTMRKIILPQAIRNALPSLGNEFISLIKETSIVGFIGAFDLTLAFRKIANDTFDFEMVYIVMGIVYFVIIYIITVLLNKLERRLLKNVKTK